MLHIFEAMCKTLFYILYKQKQRNKIINNIFFTHKNCNTSSDYLFICSLYLLKLGDGLGRPEDSLGRVGGHLGGLAVGAPPKEIVELGNKQLIRSAEIVTNS